MKKKIITLFFVIALLVVACSPKQSNQTNKIKIGVSPVPHAEIAELVKTELAKEGVELEIVIFDDYVLPNMGLQDKSIDANFFQHIPYMETFMKEKGAEFVSLGGVHVEPIALYSTKVKDIKEFKEGAEILIPLDPSNQSRALFLLQQNGLIKLKDGVGATVTEADIVENPKKIKFTAVEAALLTKAYKDVDGAVINSNYALNSQLNPLKDGLVIEGSESKYANIIAVRKEDAEKEVFKKLIKAFQSEQVKKFIEEKYKGAVVPAF
ncbi:MAG: MetQ/NlpA family ABC transporter substrate-binding protein [Tissierellia bacterium]|nr:MetQ/NlpA family ABC transporter substrate-binding protein [Tissierellia bacterium]